MNESNNSLTELEQTQVYVADPNCIVMKMKRKYTSGAPYKFGGLKKKTSNSGGVGRAGRRKRRPTIPTNVR